MTQEEPWDPAFASTCSVGKTFSLQVHTDLLPCHSRTATAPESLQLKSTKDFNLKCWRRPQALMCWGDIAEGEQSAAALESCWVFSFKEYSWCICVDSFKTGMRDSLARWTVHISLTRQFYFFSLTVFRFFWFWSLVVIMISCKMNVVTSLAVDRKTEKQINE